MSYVFYQTPASEIATCDYRETLAAVADAGGCDLVLTSPPYDDARTYGNAVSWCFEDYQALGDGVFSALKPGGHCLMVLDGPVREWRKGKGTERSFTPWRVMLDWAERVGFRVPDRLAYVHAAMPGRYEGRFRNEWEPLLWFQRTGGEPFFDKSVLRVDAKYGKPYGVTSGRRKDGQLVARLPSGDNHEKNLSNRGTLWNYGCTGKNNEEPEMLALGHPARFCVRFAEDAVKCFCPPAGLVCDPFVGSGTSAVASVRHGRRFVGGDLYGDEHGKPWALHAHERVEAVLRASPTKTASGIDSASSPGHHCAADIGEETR